MTAVAAPTTPLADALRDIVGAERVLTDRARLRTYECDGLATSGSREEVDVGR